MTPFIKIKPFAIFFSAFVAFTVFSAALITVDSDSDTTIVANGASLLWERTYGGKDDDRAFGGIAVAEGYVIVGSSASNDKGITEAWVIGIDERGNELWSRKFSENSGAEFRQVIGLPDGYLLVGNTFLASGSVDGYIVKIGLDRSVIWNLTLRAGQGTNKLFSALKVENYYVLVGLADSADSNRSSVWVVKLGEDGNLLWNKTYACSSSYSAGRAITLTSDNFIAIAGYVDITGNGNSDALIMKLDLNGNVMWQRTYGEQQTEMAYAITATKDGCVVAGNTFSEGAGDSDGLVLKINLDGCLVWKKAMGGKEYDTLTSIVQTPDGDLLGSGFTFSFGNGYRDYWLLRIDDTGEDFDSCTVGRSGYEEPYVVIPKLNDEVVMAGWTNSIGNGHYDFYVLKLQCEE